MNAFHSKMTRMALLAVCSAALTAPLAVFAQEAPPLPPAQQDGGPGGHHGGRADMQEREQHQQEMLAKKLNLTTDQQAAVKQIFTDSDAKLEALRADDSTPRDEKWPKAKAIMEDRTAAIRNLLTPQQQPQYDAIVAEQKARMQDHRDGGPGGPGGPGGGNPPPQQ